MEHRFPGQLQLRPSLVEEPAHFRIHVAHPAQSQPADTNQKRNQESERDAELDSRGVLFHCPCLLLMQHNGSTTNPGAKGSNARCDKYARLFLAPAGALVQCFDCAPAICRVKLWGKMTLLKSYLNVNGPRLGTPLRVGRASEPMCELGFGQCSARL